jgi:galactose mutarotase-like enzyme
VVGADLVMQTDTLRVAVMPALGGKIASLRWLPGDVELLQAPLIPYAARTMTMAFDEGDASGIDECLPSVAACTVVTSSGGLVQVPDHGDFWRLDWEATQQGNEIQMVAMGVSLPLRFERRLRLEGDALSFSYRVVNAGREPVAYAWSAHPLFAVDRGDRIALPSSVTEVRVEGSAGRLGAKHRQHAWPHTANGQSGKIDLSMAGGIEDGAGDKLYTESPAEGWAAIERAQHGVRVVVEFDPERSPWLGIWLCYGGWPDGKPNRQQCVAIEPCTAPMDSLAEAMATGRAHTLQPGESDEWPMRIRVCRVS